MGYYFKPKEDLILYSLGRIVSTQNNIKKLNSNHIITIKYKNEILCSVKVNGNSRIDELGFALEDTFYPIYLKKGETYLIYSTEISQSGDGYKIIKNPNMIKYKNDLIEYNNIIEENESLEGFNKLLINYGICTFYVTKKNEDMLRINPNIDFIMNPQKNNIIVGPFVHTDIIKGNNTNIIKTDTIKNTEITLVLEICEVEKINCEICIGITSNNNCNKVNDCELNINNKGNIKYKKIYNINGFEISKNSKIIFSFNPFKGFSLIHNNNRICESENLINEYFNFNNYKLILELKNGMKCNYYIKGILLI